MSDHLVLPMATIGAADGGDERIVFERGEGLRLWDTDGSEYLDAMSGLMNVAIGYGREEMARVAAESLETLSFAPSFYGLSAASAVELSERLADATPPSIDGFLFTVGGSDAVDSAIKIARRFHHVAGQPERTIIIGRRQSYHGMTLGALSAMGAPAYREGFGPLSESEFVHIDQPDADRDTSERLEAVIEEVGRESVAAFIAEPISLPPGVRIPADGYWRGVREVCSRHGILLILDEVITGYGRTGKLFAAEHWGIRPDMLVMAKGITSGYLPLGALGVSAEVWNTAIRSQSFLHGFTVGGHPASCAVALRNLEIIQREGLVDRAASMGASLKARLEDLSDEMGLGEVRGLGLLTALDIVKPGSSTSAAEWLGTDLPRRLRRDGLLIRQYGGTTMVAPSLVVTDEEMDEIVERLRSGIRSALADAPDMVSAPIARA